MFYITYYAKKHGKFITRKGQYDKPDGTKGKSFVSKNGTPCLVYWDLDNDGWRMAVGETRVRPCVLTFGATVRVVIHTKLRTVCEGLRVLRF